MLDDLEIKSQLPSIIVSCYSRHSVAAPKLKVWVGLFMTRTPLDSIYRSRIIAHGAFISRLLELKMVRVRAQDSTHLVGRVDLSCTESTQNLIKLVQGALV